MHPTKPPCTASFIFIPFPFTWIVAHYTPTIVIRGWMWWCWSRRLFVVIVHHCLNCVFCIVRVRCGCCFKYSWGTLPLVGPRIKFHFPWKSTIGSNACSFPSRATCLLHTQLTCNQQHVYANGMLLNCGPQLQLAIGT
jgi:hypothetical protein